MICLASHSDELKVCTSPAEEACWGSDQTQKTADTVSLHGQFHDINLGHLWGTSLMGVCAGGTFPKIIRWGETCPECGGTIPWAPDRINKGEKKRKPAERWHPLSLLPDLPICKQQHPVLVAILSLMGWTPSSNWETEQTLPPLSASHQVIIRAMSKVTDTRLPCLLSYQLFLPESSSALLLLLSWGTVMNPGIWITIITNLWKYINIFFSDQNGLKVQQQNISYSPLFF